jgi:hypothetical protein
MWLSCGVCRSGALAANAREHSKMDNPLGFISFSA